MSDAQSRQAEDAALDGCEPQIMRSASMYVGWVSSEGVEIEACRWRNGFEVACTVGSFRVSASQVSRRENSAAE